MNSNQSPAEMWQLQLILDYVDLMPIKEVDWLLGYYGNENQLHFWTANHDRAAELIDRLEESMQ